MDKQVDITGPAERWAATQLALSNERVSRVFHGSEIDYTTCLLSMPAQLYTCAAGLQGKTSLAEAKDGSTEVLLAEEFLQVVQGKNLSQTVHALGLFMETILGTMLLAQYEKSHAE